MKTRLGLGTFLLFTAVLGAWSPALTRSLHEWEEVRLVLLTWANGIVTSDSSKVATVLHPSFPNRDRYLDEVAGAWPGNWYVELRYVRFELISDTARVGRVVVIGDRGTFKNAFTVNFLKEASSWRISSITREPELPGELTARPLPEHKILHPVAVSVRDADTEEPIASRVHVRDEQGEYWPPDGHMRYINTMWRDVGGDVKIGDTTYAYVESDFTVRVAEGRYQIAVARGLEYEPQIVRFEVSSSDVPSVDVRLKRWSHVQQQGWYSGDTHVHFLDPQSALLELRGEDLNVVNLLATKWGELITNAEHFTGAPSPLSRQNEIVYVNEESRHGFLGHTILLNLKDLVYPLAWGSRGPGVPGGFDYPPMAHQADRTHSQGGLVSWAHFPRPIGELAVDIALGKIDAIDLMTWGDAFAEDNPTPAARTWYRFLNVGFDIPATAGTDKMQDWQVVGSVRTYVKVDGEFTYENWIAGVLAGRTFVTTGPMLTFTADTSEIGETIRANAGDVIPVCAEVRSILPVERIEIIQDGEVVASAENNDGARDLTFETVVTVEKSSWIAARAYSSERLPYNNVPVMAHTSPIYVDVDGAPRRSPDDAAFLAQWTERAIEWVQTEARFQNEAQREEMIALFENAKAVYLKQMRAASR